jgi:hypothetical protein
MKCVSRLIALTVLATLALGAAGCGSNSKKLVGKWKITELGDQTAKGKGDDKLILFLEFKADGTGGMGMEITDPELKKMMGDDKGGTLVNFKWSVSGDTLELTDTSGAKGEGPFGKKEKARGKLVFEGNDTVTIKPDDEKDKPVKLSRMK